MSVCMHVFMSRSMSITRYLTKWIRYLLCSNRALKTSLQMSLIIPGSSTAAVLSAASSSAASAKGIDALDGRLLAVLTQMKVDRAHMVILGDQGVDSTQLFGTLARDS